MTEYSGVTISYESPSGEIWPLIMPPGVPRGDTFVTLTDGGVDGFTNTLKRSFKSSVNRYGARSAGWKVEPAKIDLEYALKAPKGSLEGLMRQWRQAWETEDAGDFGPNVVYSSGKLHVSSDVGGQFWTPVTGAEFPDWEDSLVHRRSYQEKMSCVSPVGHWFGRAESYSGRFTFIPLGDKPLAPRLRLLWDGRATSVGFPSGMVVNLPKIDGPRVINLDRGMSGQVTRPNGVVDTYAWSSLQGIIGGVTLRPGSASSWNLGAGVSLEVTPRHLSPWR